MDEGGTSGGWTTLIRNHFGIVIAGLYCVPATPRPHDGPNAISHSVIQSCEVVEDQLAVERGLIGVSAGYDIPQRRSDLASVAKNSFTK